MKSSLSFPPSWAQFSATPGCTWQMRWNMDVEPTVVCGISQSFPAIEEYSLFPRTLETLAVKWSPFRGGSPGFCHRWKPWTEFSFTLVSTGGDIFLAAMGNGF